MQRITQLWKSGIRGKLLIGCGGLLALLFACLIIIMAIPTTPKATETPTPVVANTATAALKPTQTPVPPTPTKAKSTATGVPATPTSVPATLTSMPSTATKASPPPTATSAPATTGCPQGCITPPPSCIIKGNISSSGEKIYHMPGQRDYDKTVIDPSKGERWFCTEAEAIANGWRRAEQ